MTREERDRERSAREMLISLGGFFSVAEWSESLWSKWSRQRKAG